MKKVLVFGSSGMIGHKVFQVLSDNSDLVLFNASRSKLNENTEFVDFREHDQIIDIIKKVKPDVVVNAAGILIEHSKDNPLEAVALNSMLPLILNVLSETYKFKLIQISTDCVFSGDEGPYEVSDIADSKTIYGRTKALGEFVNPSNLVIRTSVIGPDLKPSGKELFNWFMNQTNSVKGFSKSVWSGVTTLELAKCIEYCVLNNIEGKHHLTSKNSITKYNLLKILNGYLKHPLKIIKVDGVVTNKNLKKGDETFYSMTKNYDDLIKEMMEDILESDSYSHYIRALKSSIVL